MDDLNREFWIAEDKEAELISKMLSIYSFAIKTNEFEKLIEKANKFLKEMKKDKDTDYWKPYQYYKIENIKQNYLLSQETDLSQKLQSLSIGARLHFFDYAMVYNYKTYWSGDSSYKTRSFGVFEPVSLENIKKLDIFEQVQELECIPEIASKIEIKENAEQKGFEIKKSWTLAKIYENLLKTEEGKEFLTTYLDNQNVLRFKDYYKTDLKNILEYQQEIRKIADLLVMI